MTNHPCHQEGCEKVGGIAVAFDDSDESYCLCTEHATDLYNDEDRKGTVSFMVL